MIKVSHNDKDFVVNIITEAFKNNKSIHFVIGKKGDFIQKLKYLISYSFEEGMDFGEVFMNNEKTSVAIFIHPDKKRTTVKSILRDMKLIFKVIGIANITKVLARDKKIKVFHPKANDFSHLWYIATEENSQGKGHGSAFLQELIHHYQDRKILLETSTKENFPFYEKNGFYEKGIVPLESYQLHIFST